jgi:hypothetical protein
LINRKNRLKFENWLDPTKILVQEPGLFFIALITPIISIFPVKLLLIPNNQFLALIFTLTFMVQLTVTFSLKMV